MPTGEQQRQMRPCRFFFNQALALQRYERGAKKLAYAGLCTLLTEWRNGTPWLKDAPCHPLQQSLKDLERAYANFFAQRTQFPRGKATACATPIPPATPCALPAAHGAQGQIQQPLDHRAQMAGPLPGIGQGRIV